MDLKKAFGMVILDLRQKRKMSQEVLALEAEFSRRFIYKLEHGLQLPSIETVFRLAKTLSIKPADLMERVDRMTRK